MYKGAAPLQSNNIVNYHLVGNLFTAFARHIYAKIYICVT